MLVGKHVHQMVGPAGGLEAAGGLKQGSQEDGCCARAPGHGVGCSLIRAPSRNKQADVRAGVLPPEARECGRTCEGRCGLRTGEEAMLFSGTRSWSQMPLPLFVCFL